MAIKVIKGWLEPALMKLTILNGTMNALQTEKRHFASVIALEYIYPTKEA